ncbi:MAG: YjbA family protein [Sporolactobacillus sp.]|nr:YjbA family protein [Sporolactobacillus sp.]
MEVVNDVWVNWFEGEENGYNVCEFYEWRKHDFIELLDQVPLIKVTETLFDYIENDLRDLPEELLNDVRNQSVICKNNRRETIEYCFIASDGRRCIAADTLGYAVPLRKSRLISRQEETVLGRVEKMPAKNYPIPFGSGPKEYHMLSLSPEMMIGLTRRERQLKQILFMALDQLHTTGSTEETRYWFTEWYPTRYEESRMMDGDEAFRELVAGLKQGWSTRHSDLCERMIKGQSYFEKLWNLEQGTKVQ